MPISTPSTFGEGGIGKLTEPWDRLEVMEIMGEYLRETALEPEVDKVFVEAIVSEALAQWAHI